MRVLLALAIVLGCSQPASRPTPIAEPPTGGTATTTATSTTETTTTNTTSTQSSTTSGPPPLASCPATYAEAETGACTLAQIDKLSCAYREGACACNAYRPCAGVAGAYEEARAHPRPAWSCTPKIRADGCTSEQPAVGSACAKDAQECTYGSCGGHVLACRSGKWEIARTIAPPPAAHR